jgi:predicted nucleotidyltransferase component of viral defense system
VIPQANIIAWRLHAPWPTGLQIEQDLILSRAIVELFQDSVILENLAFRGGTALNKLHLMSAVRYSEDIDLVQVQPGPIGPVMDAIRARLSPWLGLPSWKQGKGRVTFYFRYETEGPPAIQHKLKIEINTREHDSFLGLQSLNFGVDNPWFVGSAAVTTYNLDEMLGTKLRALYQRKKGRDLFDLWAAGQGAVINPDQIVRCMLHYVQQEGRDVTRALFESNLQAKCMDLLFRRDIEPLLAQGTLWNFDDAATYVLNTFVARLPGEPAPKP